MGAGRRGRGKAGTMPCPLAKLSLMHRSGPETSTAGWRELGNVSALACASVRPGSGGERKKKKGNKGNEAGQPGERGRWRRGKSGLRGEKFNRAEEESEKREAEAPYGIASGEKS